MMLGCATTLMAGVKRRSESGDAQERARSLIASLREGMESSDAVFDAFHELDALPLDVVREELAPWVGAQPDLDRLDQETRQAHRFPPRSLRLRTLTLVRDADFLDLGPIAEAQLRLAGQHWEGCDRSPEERLDGELDGSFAGTLEYRVLGEYETPLFDVLRYEGDSGIIFASGTTKVIGAIADGCIEVAERRTRDAIREALAPVEAPPAPKRASTKKKTAAKKKSTTAKKTTAKKTRAKKT